MTVQSGHRVSSGGESVLFTIGYEGRDVPDLVGRLVEHGVDVLVDVRERAQSRKTGFSKTALSEELGDAGIDYLHVPALGSPRALRQWARETGDVDTFFVEYRRHLDGHLDSIRQVADLGRSKRICLLCFEEDHRMCHRSVVARSARASMRGRIQHL